MLNKKKVETIVSLYNELLEQISDLTINVANYKDKLKLNDSYFNYSQAGQPEVGEYISYSWDQSCSRGCCSDYYSFSYPSWYLYVDESEWKADLDKQLLKQREQTRLKKEKLHQEELERKRKQLEALTKELECQK